MSHALRGTGISARFGTTTILADVSVSVPVGTAVALLGPNGSGKSTLLRILAGLPPAEASCTGTVSGAQFSYLAQPGSGAAPRWDLPLTVSDVVRSGLLDRRRWRSRRSIEPALAAVGMLDEARTPIAALSGGRRQRVLLARALVPEPAVLLLDEPFTGLDVETTASLRQTLATLRAGGIAILAALHDPELARTDFDQILGLSGGRLRAEPAWAS